MHVECWLLCESTSAQAPGGLSGAIEGEETVRRMEKVLFCGKLSVTLDHPAMGTFQGGTTWKGGALSSSAPATFAVTSVHSDMWQGPAAGGRTMAVPSRVVVTSGIVMVNGKAWLSPYLPSLRWAKAALAGPQPHAVVQSLQLWWVTGKGTELGTGDVYTLPRVPVEAYVLRSGSWPSPGVFCRAERLTPTGQDLPSGWVWSVGGGTKVR